MELQITLILKLGGAPSSGGATVAIYNDASHTPNAQIASVGRILDSQLTTTPTAITMAWSGVLASQTRYWIALLRDPGSNILWAVSSTSSGVGVAGEYTYDTLSGSVLNGLPYEMRLTDGIGIYTNVQPAMESAVGTFAVGSLANSEVVLPGNSAVWAVGTIKAEIDKVLIGVSATGQVGNPLADSTFATSLDGVSMSSTAGGFGELVEEFLVGAGFEGLVGFAGVISDGDHTNVEMPGLLGIFQVGDITTNITQTRDLQGVTIQSHVGSIIADVIYTLIGNEFHGSAGDFTSVISAEGWLMDDLLITTKPVQPDDFDVSLIYSDDKGATWSFPTEQTIGALGDYITDLQWQRLGMARDRIFAIQWSSPCRTSLIGVFVDVMQGKT